MSFHSKIPVGHIFVNNRFNGSELLSILRRQVQIVIINTVDFVDFFPLDNFAVVYISEADLLSSLNYYKRKLVKLRKANYQKKVVIADKTDASSKFFKDIQKFAVLELDLGLVPVSDLTDCCNVLAHLVKLGSRERNNPFTLKRRMPPSAVCILNSLTKIPQLGERKAELLLQKFQSLSGIAEASLQDLEGTVGTGCAQQVYNFFHVV